MEEEGETTVRAVEHPCDADGQSLIAEGIANYAAGLFTIDGYAEGRFSEANVDVNANVITIPPHSNLKAGDPIKFRIVNSRTGAAGTGTLPAPISATATYYVRTYAANTGAFTISATAGGTALDITNDGTAVAPNEFEVYYAG